MERRIKEFTGTIAGEDATRSVGAVRPRGEPYDDDACLRVAEAWHRAPPVRLIAVSGALLARHPLAKGNQPRTAAARHDLVVQNPEHPVGCFQGAQLVSS